MLQLAGAFVVGLVCGVVLVPWLAWLAWRAAVKALVIRPPAKTL